MAKHHTLDLTESEIQALVELRDNGKPAYLRERATAILKIHQGFSPHEVAGRGLLKKRDPDTVYAWVRRYREHGLHGLSHKPGRGRKPAFYPSHLKPPNQNSYKLSLKNELGDVLWYLTQICTELGLTLEEVAETNIAKLSSRQERGKIRGDGDNR